MTSRWRTRVRRDYVDWLSLVSHEFFHAWNVKRLRPVELGPFEYERENYTKTLWVAEGFTDYYADLVAVRAGVMSPEEALGSLSETIASLQTTPGRLVQSVEEASFDAWVRYYRPDENTPNTTISYYTKGAVIGFLLDLKIRRATNNARSLDDLMTQAYARYSGAKGYTSTEFRALASEVAGIDLSAWFRTALDTTDELVLRRPGVARPALQTRTALDPALGGPDDGDAGRDAAKRQRPARGAASAPRHAGVSTPA